MSKPLPVIIRYEGPGKATRPVWHHHDLLAVFPTEPGDDEARSMSCYSTLGEHSSCASGYIGRKTKPATAVQIEVMLSELRRRGYKNLKVVSRVSSHHTAERRRALEIKP